MMFFFVCLFLFCFVVFVVVVVFQLNHELICIPGNLITWNFFL